MKIISKNRRKNFYLKRLMRDIRVLLKAKYLLSLLLKVKEVLC